MFLKTLHDKSIHPFVLGLNFTVPSLFQFSASFALPLFRGGESDTANPPFRECGPADRAIKGAQTWGHNTGHELQTSPKTITAPCQSPRASRARCQQLRSSGTMTAFYCSPLCSQPGVCQLAHLRPILQCMLKIHTVCLNPTAYAKLQLVKAKTSSNVTDTQGEEKNYFVLFLIQIYH